MYLNKVALFCKKVLQNEKNRFIFALAKPPQGLQSS